MGNLAKQLGKKLRALRGETSRLQFSRKIGISRSSYQRMEMGEQNVTLEMLEYLTKRLKCGVGDLFAVEEKASDEDED